MFNNLFLVIVGLLRHPDSELTILDSKLYYAIHQAKSAFDLSSSTLSSLLTVIMVLNLAIICLIVGLVYCYAKG